MKLIPNASQAWRMWSMQAIAAVAAVQTVWLALPESLRATVPPETVHWLTLLFAAAAALGRIVKQFDAWADTQPGAQQ